MTVSAQQKKNASRFVLLTVFCYAIGFGIIMPVLPELIVELEGVSLSEAALLGGFIAAAYAIFQFLMGPLVGNLGDRFGRRPVFLLSLAGFSIDFVMMGFAQNIIWLFVGRSVAGALGAIFGPANAAMADISTGEDRAKGFGLVGGAFGIGFIIGPALGGLLGEYGTRIPFFVAGALAAAIFVYGYFMFPETMSKTDHRKFSLKRANPIGALMSMRKFPGVVRISMIYFIWITSTNIYPISWAYFSQIQFAWDSKMVGISLTIVGVSMALGQAVLLGRAVKKWGERQVAIIGLVAASSLMVFHTFNTSGALALAACLLVGLQGMVMPSINAMMSRRTPANSQGELQGFNGSLSALAALSAPLIYNTTLSYATSEQTPYYFPSAPFIISLALALIALVALLRVKPSATIEHVTEQGS